MTLFRAPIPLTVRPGPPLRGRFSPPGDKSITHRAYLMGLLADGESTVEGPNPGADCEATLSCCARVGARVARTPEAVRIGGSRPRITEPESVLECGNSGTTLRLMSGILAAQPWLAVLSGDASLNRRPVARVIEPLRRMGARLHARGGDRFPPLVVQGGALTPITYALPVASAQVASCVLLAGLHAAGRTAVELPGQARDHTERMLGAFGVEVVIAPRPGLGPRLEVQGPARLRAARLRVPGDFSAAAFFLAAAAATPGAEVTATSVGLNPTRTGLLDVLEAMGAGVSRTPRGEQAGEPVGEVTVTGPDHLDAFAVPPEWLPRLVDEVPAWTIAALAARGTSLLSGAAELRVKESDRLAVLARQLGALGGTVREHADGLEIEGGRPLRGGTVSAANDHRIAMALVLLGLRAREPVTVDDAASIATSYPGFRDALAALGGEVVDPRAGGGA